MNYERLLGNPSRENILQYIDEQKIYPVLSILNRLENNMVIILLCQRELTIPNDYLIFLISNSSGWNFRTFLNEITDYRFINIAFDYNLLTQYQINIIELLIIYNKLLINNNFVINAVADINFYNKIEIGIQLKFTLLGLDQRDSSLQQSFSSLWLYDPAVWRYIGKFIDQNLNRE